MAVPANDAYTFGLVHDSGHRRRTSSLSPKFTFASAPSPIRSKAHHAKGMNSVLPKRKGGAIVAAATAVSSRSNKGGGGGRDQHENGDAHHQVTAATMITTSDARPLANGTHVKGGPKKRVIDWEIPRKTLHSSVGFLTLYLYISHRDPRTIVLGLSTALAVIVPADIIRLRSSWFERIYERCLGFLMRESEKSSSNGVIWYILGTTIVLTVFPLDIATVAILTLSWADTAASTFGRLFGSYTRPLPRRMPLLGVPLAPRKSLAGFIASSVTGACIAMGFWRWVGPYRTEALSWTWEEGLSEGMRVGWAGRARLGLGWDGVGTHTGGWMGLGAIGLVAGLVAGVAEALDVGSLDDNLTLPVVSGLCLYGFLKLMGLFAR